MGRNFQRTLKAFRVGKHPKGEGLAEGHLLLKFELEQGGMMSGEVEAEFVELAPLTEQETRFYTAAALMYLSPDEVHQAVTLWDRRQELGPLGVLRAIGLRHEAYDRIGGMGDTPDEQMEQVLPCAQIALVGSSEADEPIDFNRDAYGLARQEVKNYLLITSLDGPTEKSIRQRYFAGMPAGHWVYIVWTIMDALGRERQYGPWSHYIEGRTKDLD